MKKKILFLGLILAAFTMNAQDYNVEDANGDQILDGSVRTYGVYTYPEASLDFFVNNTTSNEIYTKIEKEGFGIEMIVYLGNY